MKSKCAFLITLLLLTGCYAQSANTPKEDIGYNLVLLEQINLYRMEKKQNQLRFDATLFERIGKFLTAPSAGRHKWTRRSGNRAQIMPMLALVPVRSRIVTVAKECSHPLPLRSVSN